MTSAGGPGRRHLAVRAPRRSRGSAAVAGGVDRAVGVQDDGLRRAHAGVVVGALHERVEPAGLRLAVVVEEDEVPAPRERGRLVAGACEAHVLVVAHELDPVARRGLVPRAVIRGVVDDDGLVHAGHGRRGEGVQAAAEASAPPVVHDHHAGRDWFAHGS